MNVSKNKNDILKLNIDFLQSWISSHTAVVGGGVGVVALVVIVVVVCILYRYLLPFYNFIPTARLIGHL